MINKVKRIIQILHENNCVKYVDDEQNNVDLVTTARNVGITIKEKQLEDGVRGLVCIDKDNPENLEILVRDTHPEEEKKITIAHEIGHALLHFSPRRHTDSSEYKDSIFYMKDNSHYTIEEREANAFTGELIMPEDKLQDFIMKHADKGVIDLSQVAKAFGVTTSAVSTRAQELNLID